MRFPRASLIFAGIVLAAAPDVMVAHADHGVHPTPVQAQQPYPPPAPYPANPAPPIYSPYGPAGHSRRVSRRTSRRVTRRR